MESGEPPPRDYHASFTALGKLGALPDDFARSISAAAGLRNRIADEYEDIDPGRVHDALGRVLEDVPRYARYVMSCLDSEG